jgi:hypothetical protein
MPPVAGFPLRIPFEKAIQVQTIKMRRAAASSVMEIILRIGVS